jgi:DHA2 family multidrug resistance protein
MTSTALSPARAAGSAGRLLVVGVVLAALTEAIAGTALSLGRADIIGDIHATPDEFAWLDVGYTAMKFTGFMLGPWLLGRGGARTTMLAATLIIGAACAAAALTTSLDLLIALRSLQGLAGGLLLVAGQTILFQVYPRAQQPLIQAVFAMGAVVAPATLAPALQGWLVDSQSWAWIFLSVAPLSLAAAGLMLLARGTDPPVADRRPFDPAGLALISLSLFCLTYVFSQGARWDWFEAPRIVWLTTLGAAAMIGFIGQQILIGGRGLLDFSAFRSDDFTFAFIVSFVAGAALFGSAWIIPSFAVSLLAFTPTDAGLLLLPSGAVFVAALLLAAFLMQARRLPPIATAPLGILLTIVAMWMLSGSTHESGAGDMMVALLVRGLGLGFLFLPITLVAFGGLGRAALATGIGLFNTGRQLGGLIGVAALQTMIGHDTAANQTALAAHVAAGVPALSERLAATTSLLMARGMDAAAAGRAATSLLGGTVAGQSTVIAFETAFDSLALLLVFAAPVVIAVKIGLARSAKARAGWREAQGAKA